MGVFHIFKSPPRSWKLNFVHMLWLIVMPISNHLIAGGGNSTGGGNRGHSIVAVRYERPRHRIFVPPSPLPHPPRSTWSNPYALPDTKLARETCDTEVSPRADRSNSQWYTKSVLSTSVLNYHYTSRHLLAHSVTYRETLSTNSDLLISVRSTKFCRCWNTDLFISTHCYWWVVWSVFI